MSCSNRDTKPALARDAQLIAGNSGRVAGQGAGSGAICHRTVGVEAGAVTGADELIQAWREVDGSALVRAGGGHRYVAPGGSFGHNDTAIVPVDEALGRVV